MIALKADDRFCQNFFRQHKKNSLLKEKNKEER
jgi:hypothetical protein